MGESRGKKGKKARWQVQLGVKETIFAGLGLAGLLMMSFALGTLAGRGDIYRVLYNWGLLGTDAGRAVHVLPHAVPPPTTPVAAPTSAQTPPAAPGVSPSQTTASAQPQGAAPTQGNVAQAPSPAHAPKKSNKPDPKAKNNDLQRMRREVASKLKFQNKMDQADSKSAPSGEKGKTARDKQEKATSSRPTTTRIFVAKFRDGHRARTKLAEMRKKGEKVTLKEGKDSEGRYFAIYREVATSPPQSQSVAHSSLKKKKTGTNPSKSSGQN